jgi:hypothetical protein
VCNNGMGTVGGAWAGGGFVWRWAPPPPTKIDKTFFASWRRLQRVVGASSGRSPDAELTPLCSF